MNFRNAYKSNVGDSEKIDTRYLVARAQINLHINLLFLKIGFEKIRIIFCSQTVGMY